MFAANNIIKSILGNMPIHASPIQAETRQKNHMPTLQEIIEQRILCATFQPIFNLKTGEFYGYERLIRRPSDSPFNLFGAAAQQKLTLEVEMISRQCAVLLRALSG